MLPTSPPFLFAHPLLLVHDHLLQKVLGKARTLLECLVETILAAVVGVANHFGLLRAAVLAKEHHLGLGVFVLALETFEIRQVGEIHGEDVVEPIKVASRNLNTNDLLACTSTLSQVADSRSSRSREAQTYAARIVVVVENLVAL